jgi:uncharacterized repeat protein (TIGR02543 family)
MKNFMMLFILVTPFVLFCAGCESGSSETNLTVGETSYSITYDANGSTDGSVPEDESKYVQGATVTVQSNSGLLKKSGGSFAGWNSEADGSGDDYTPGDFFSMGAEDVTLYAQWEEVPILFSFFKSENPLLEDEFSTLKDGNMLRLNVPYGTDLTSFVPTIEFDGVSISPQSGVANDFSKDVTYTVTKADNSTVTYTVRVFYTVTRLELYVLAELNEDVTRLDVSNITDMSKLFNDATNFNQDISTWDVSNVTDMHKMFKNADSFNQDISEWDVSNVTDMSEMFLNALSFNNGGNPTGLNNWDSDTGTWAGSNTPTKTIMFDSSGMTAQKPTWY